MNSLQKKKKKKGKNVVEYKGYSILGNADKLLGLAQKIGYFDGKSLTEVEVGYLNSVFPNTRPVETAIWRQRIKRSLTFKEFEKDHLSCKMNDVLMMLKEKGHSLDSIGRDPRLKMKGSIYTDLRSKYKLWDKESSRVFMDFAKPLLSGKLPDGMIAGDDGEVGAPEPVELEGTDQNCTLVEGRSYVITVGSSVHKGIYVGIDSVISGLLFQRHDSDRRFVIGTNQYQVISDN